MRFTSKDLKRFAPGLAAGIMIIATTSMLLFLSMEENGPPEAHITGSSEITEVGAPVFFDGRNSTDPDGDEIEYHWTINETVHVFRPFFHYSFPGPGNFTVVLLVTDPSGRSDTATVIIDVR